MTDITTSTETSGDNFTFSADDQILVIDQGVSVISDTGDAVFSGKSGNQTVNFGNIFAGAVGIYSEDSNGSNGVIENAAPGNIYAQYGIFSNETGDLIINNGSVDGSVQGIGVNGASSICRNSGHVYGRSEGVHFYSTGETLNNSGTISSSGDGVYIANTGGGSIVNTGTIQGDAYAIFDGSAGPTTITNRGAIHGDVQLGNGTDTFDGRRGTMDGTIIGGNGVDTIRLGNDGEIVNGGAGHDKLYGGTGADTFAFTSDGTSSDHIYNFNVTNDTIQLAHSTFAKLAVGATPVFSIGTKATGPNDYLFYNDVGGGLWYDSDGTGSQAAVAIANLGPGLKLTAHDFTVV